MESSILIDVWTVDPSRREELVAGIGRLLSEVIGAQPGLVSSRAYESVTGDAILVTVEMRSVQERQQLMELPAVRKGLRELRAIAHNHTRLVREIDGVGGPGQASVPS